MSTGVGLLMVNVWELLVPPPGVGLNTVTEAVPVVAMSPAGIAARNWPLLTKVVARLLLFQRTTEVLTKLEPFTVSVKSTPPAVVLVGDVLVSVGTGLVTVNVCGAVTPPPGPGLKTVTWGVPPTEMSLAGIVAVNCPLFTNTVVRLLPFQRTTELLMKFDPVTVKVNCGSPACLVVGEIMVSVGAGLLMVKVYGPTMFLPSEMVKVKLSSPLLLGV